MTDHLIRVFFPKSWDIFRCQGALSNHGIKPRYGWILIELDGGGYRAIEASC